MSTILTSYNPSECEELVKYFTSSRQKLMLYMYNIYGDLIYQFPLSCIGVTTVHIPCPTHDYYIVKLIDVHRQKHHYIILKPNDEEERYLFFLKPYSEIVRIEGENGVLNRKLIRLFPDLFYCDISELELGKYTIYDGKNIYGFEIRNSVYKVRSIDRSK